jgi:serralysin
MAPYDGPVPGLENQFITFTPDSLCIADTAPNAFIHAGDGDDAISVASGNNVLDGGRGSNFLTGGSDNDTFFLDCRNPCVDVWSTIVNFHPGDTLTMWGITPDNMLKMADKQGANGYQGLTLTASRPGSPDCGVTICGYSTQNADKLSASFGHSADTPGAQGANYLMITAT